MKWSALVEKLARLRTRRSAAPIKDTSEGKDSVEEASCTGFLPEEIEEIQRGIGLKLAAEHVRFLRERGKRSEILRDVFVLSFRDVETVITLKADAVCENDYYKTLDDPGETFAQSVFFGQESGWLFVYYESVLLDSDEPPPDDPKIYLWQIDKGITPQQKTFSEFVAACIDVSERRPLNPFS